MVPKKQQHSRGGGRRFPKVVDGFEQAPSVLDILLS
jgi:hypothetical protein